MNNISVLSLFDGISCGRLALDRLGISVNSYYSSEIEPHAIKISQKHYPDNIQLGDCTKIDYTNLPHINLLIGGSPCQNLSNVNNKDNRGLEGEKSKLFYEYVRALRECKPDYFLFENVMSMKNKDRDIISKLLGVSPLSINSSCVSAQNRNRYYWTNIPQSLIIHKNILFKDILEREREWKDIQKWCNNTYHGKKRIDELGMITDEKSHTVTTNKTHPHMHYLNKTKTKLTTLSCIEVERLQTLPDNYTYGIPNKYRYQCVGNGWTVDVIKELLRGII